MEINEAINEDNEGFTSSLQKPKKPRTEKQKEALRKAQIKRKENIEKRKAEKLQNQQINPSLNGINEECLFDQRDTRQACLVSLWFDMNPAVTYLNIEPILIP